MEMYWRVEVSSFAFLTLALDGGEWSASCHSLSAGKVTYLLDKRLGGPQRWSGHSGEEKTELQLSSP